VIQIKTSGYVHYFLISYLPWDSDYFNVASYRFFTILFEHTDFEALTDAIREFKEIFFNQPKYIFIEIPSEDILLIQALNFLQFKLIETRLTYYRGELNNYENKRFTVREAQITDIENLKKVAYENRNIYDRFHADYYFNNAVADNYLATYVEEATKGFTDLVLVPYEEDTPSDAFIALSFLKKDAELLNCQLCRIVLTAVAPTCQGWHYKLVSEATYKAKSINARYMLMTTQSTNRAVIKNCEKLGYNLGATTHILSCHK
jgi:dTDP-4-amino-4,6-dideoxy-D-galactose acyltransferase